MEHSKVTVIIPSYKPDGKLMETVAGLTDAGFEDILILNDGSGDEFDSIFSDINEIKGCTVISHSENRGKGAALKSAFKWYLENRKGIGVITVDGDGQHKPCDVVRCADKLCEKKDTVILGARDFKNSQIPGRSAFGNSVSKGVFRVFARMKINDTQTGLRAIPEKHLADFCKISGDRYEYETNMLLQMKRNKVPYEEQTIEAVYTEDNESSHFRPIRDSFRIYKLIFKYMFTSSFAKFLGSSMICYFLDFFLFSVLNYLFGNIMLAFWATVFSYGIARISSSFLNFSLNRKIFKGHTGPVWKAVIKYYLLVAFNIAVGSLLVYLLSRGLSSIGAVESFCRSFSALFKSLFSVEPGVSTVLEAMIKLPVDGLLYFLSYNVQKRYVFKKDAE